ncbi:MAG: pyridoxamine kinase [Clostridia bacterium]|nr:pyridoxamine kinase [Clostridia bacterium]
MTGCSPRVAAIHDLSGIGRCSLTVIIPILAVMGVEPCPVPTAVLSTHTGGFGDPALFDLTNFVTPCMNHWKQIGVKFDCIYSGFLANEMQTEQVEAFIGAWPEALAVVDPVLGDDGKSYRTCTPALTAKMRGLIKKADLITPNMTEACILLNQEYTAASVGREAARSMLVRLSEKGPRMVVVIGAQVSPGVISNIGYDRSNNSFWRVDCSYTPIRYPGVGDVFSSVLVGGLLTGDSLPLAITRATRFIELAASTAFGYNSPRREGVMLEKSLPWLVQRQICTGYEPL